MRQAEAMFAQIRRKSIVEWINAQGVVTVNELCDRYSVSPATIRNDLRDLESAHMIERTHGGAVSCRKVAYELNTAQKSTQRIFEKKKIAQAALKHIHPGDSIFLDSGTTTYELARLLSGFERLIVVTYDLQIANWLEGNTDVYVIMAGGIVRRNFHCTVGQTTVDTLEKLHVDTLFLATNAIDENGLYTPSLEMGAIKSTLIRNADSTILLADSTKMKHSSFSRFASLDALDTLIVDCGIDPAFAQQLRETGIQLECV